MTLLPDPATAIAAAAIANGAAKTAEAFGVTEGGKEFFKRVCGYLGDEVVRGLESIKEQRRRNSVWIVNRASVMAAEAGIEPRTVPLRLMAPILHGASNEDEYSMQERWAALLANAAARPQAIPPLFANVLGNITPFAAVVLEAYEDVERREHAAATDLGPSAEKIADYIFGSGAWEDAKEEGAVACLEATMTAIVELDGLRMLDAPGRWGMPPLEVTPTHPFRITPAGKGLLRACRAPTRECKP